MTEAAMRVRIDSAAIEAEILGLLVDGHDGIVNVEVKAGDVVLGTVPVLIRTDEDGIVWADTEHGAYRIGRSW